MAGATEERGKPTIVCIPGAWHSPEGYEASFRNLRNHGYECIGVPLPSVNADPAHDNFNKDIQSIRDVLLQLIERDNKDVVLVAHSYGGKPAGEASLGLGKKDRVSKGLKSGITRLVFIQAYALSEGLARVGDVATWMKFDEETRLVTVSPEDAKDVFYHDIPEAEANEWIAKLRPHSAGVFASKVTRAAWRDIPTTFVRGLQDRTSINEEMVDEMISVARRENPNAFDVVEVSPDAGHCLMVSYPDWLAECLSRATEI